MALDTSRKIVGVWNETYTGDLGSVVKVHKVDHTLSMATGTSNSQADEVWSDTRSAAGAVDDLDLAGTLTAADGSTITFVEVTGVYIRNKSTTTAETLTIGAGSNPFITWLIATGDGVVIGPNGTFLIESPVDGYTVTAGTADILRVDPGANTISYDIVIWGRSA